MPFSVETTTYIMRLNIRLRLMALGIGAGMMGALIVFILLNSRQQAFELRTRLNNVGQESSGIMDQFKESLRELNSDILNYGTDHDPAIWQTTLTTSRKLGTWINEQKKSLHTQAEINLLQQIQIAYDNYLHAALKFHAKVESIGRWSVSLDDFTPVREQSQRLFDLGQTLARAHYETHDQLLLRANHSLKQLYYSVLILLGLLFAFGMALGIGIYRHLIIPLRIRLVETHALVERREKMASLGLLAAGVAHEVRSPLTSIKVGLCFQKTKFPPGSAGRADAEVVEREILRLENILDEFLTFTQPPAPNLVALQLNTFIQEMGGYFASQLKRVNIQFVTEILSPIQVMADAAQLKQVIINLVQNAANSIGRDGQITLRARSDHGLLAGKETSVAILEVADTGQGNAPEMEKQLFQPFFPTKENGVGPGLSIGAQIVQALGGELQYQTHVNHSTVFAIVLPQLNA
jgi:signal transduction histidine kinase